jgi:hypothetical protein
MNMNNVFEVNVPSSFEEQVVGRGGVAMLAFEGI